MSLESQINIQPSKFMQKLMDPTIFQMVLPLTQKYKAINLASGFPDWETPEFLCNAVTEAFRLPEHQYAPVGGHPTLIQKLCERYSKSLNRDIIPQNVSIGLGASGVIFDIYSAFLNEGDELIVFEPFFEQYSKAAKLLGVNVKACSLIEPEDFENGEWQIDFDQFENLIDQKTRIVILNSPHNPTGKVFTREEYQKIANIVKKYPKVLVIADDIYEILVYDKKEFPRFVDIPGMFERTLQVFSLGKLFSCTGWRIGFCIGHEELIKIVRATHSIITYNVHRPVQIGFAKALDEAKSKYMGTDDNYEENMVNYIYFDTYTLKFGEWRLLVSTYLIKNKIPKQFLSFYQLLQMIDFLSKSQSSCSSKQKKKGFLSNDYTLYSATNRIQSPMCLNTPKSTFLGQDTLDKQKLRSSSRQNEQTLIKNIFDIPNKCQSSKSFINPSQHKEQQLDKTIFLAAEQENDQKIKIFKQPSSKSLSIQKYKELISNASHSTMHLPALRIGQQKISEFSHQSLDKTIKDGFTSFSQIKIQNQDYLINLHQKRQSINNILDIQDLENERSIQKQRSLQKNRRVDYKYDNIEYVQLELEHNKAMQSTFISNNEQSLIKKNKETFLNLIQREQKISKMPTIRKYPMQRKKQIQNIQNQQDYNNDAQHQQEQKKYHHEGMKDQEQIYKIYIYTIPQNDWKPSVREGATIVADKNKAYLFGGLGQDIFNQVEVLDLEQNLKWHTLDHNSTKNNTPVVRFGHSMHYYKGSLIVFGGETHFNTNFKQKQCLCDIFALSIDQKKWAQINVTGDIPQGRRGHASCIVGRWLIIHGGSNFRDFTLSDVWAFDLGILNLQWFLKIILI
ncbi:classes I and II family aminotransferase (macronuclear) [Tetrahymena thermophila SB210]|uniref:Classes I and II family aminotransferase n=1 Tax=Tetrahymena thermophila (strain SB210) TaxID=312017 RepID=I7MKR2_TETTS|nr:classes I and II family aminotransferase [Tetrahymena thermophila SB210]EAR99870.2 classes I and II family aminotransferase [Tetrahymena thermophila SB210]|eukprot:XP_001020115.2 classes I and II family aminotransferase [Tetrahymena thermophila SB210]